MIACRESGIDIKRRKENVNLLFLLW